MRIGRRDWIASAGGGLLAALGLDSSAALGDEKPAGGLTITGLKVTPIALPDPPILAASGCHGPYFLRNVIEIETDAGITGIGETHGGDAVTSALERCRPLLIGKSAFAYRRFAPEVTRIGLSAYAGIEIASLDAIGKATKRSVSELLGGPVRDEVELSSYLFFRYAADDPRLLADPRIADARGRGEKALDPWGEVRTPEAMAELAWRFHQKWGFRCHKLKGGVLEPEVELQTLKAMESRLGPGHVFRIDPNGRWKLETALRMGEKLKTLPLEYYEDPVDGQEAMAEVRRKTGLRMSTNDCVTSFDHIPDAIRTKPIDVVLCDHHYWGGIPACQALGRIAESLGWGVGQHSNSHAGITFAAMVHLAAVLPQLTYASDTHSPWLPEGADITSGANLKIAGGKAKVPRGPGLGVDLDRDRLARAAETQRKCGMRSRDDATTMRLVEPGWRRDRY